jgi:hypothetical protein
MKGLQGRVVAVWKESKHHYCPETSLPGMIEHRKPITDKSIIKNRQATKSN